MRAISGLPTVFLFSARRRALLFGFLSALGLCAGHRASCQVGVKLETDRNHYIRYEPIQATVTLRNYAGNTLVFGTSEASESISGALRFNVVRSGSLSRAPRHRDVNPVENLILAPGDTRQLKLQLNSIVDMSREGSYTVTARVNHPRLSQDYESKETSLTVRAGLAVWEREVGVPQRDETSAIQQRTVSLLRFRQEEGQTYALQVRDTNTVYGIIRLGPYMSGSHPECRIDAMSNIHLLYQLTPRLFVYRVYGIDVSLRQNLYYAMGEDQPVLVRDPELGRVAVVGGRRAIPGKDYRPGGERGGDLLGGEYRPRRTPEDALTDPRSAQERFDSLRPNRR